jgi:hypothetical protein
MMKKFMIALILISFTISCEEKFFSEGVDCAECYQEKPEEADLIIDLTINDTYSYVPIVVYRNDFEDNDIEYIDTAYESPYYLPATPINKKYSVAAEYISGDNKIIAVDGSHLKVRHVLFACDEDCWIIEGGEMDVRLKYKSIH